jgi:branched-subunit amino acid aminotransferase/4-amino-4-deoxychorismate lyase
MVVDITTTLITCFDGRFSALEQHMDRLEQCMDRLDGRETGHVQPIRRALNGRLAEA